MAKNKPIKKKVKKKKISKTEKKLVGKKRYQQSKRNKLYKDLNNIEAYLNTIKADKTDKKSKDKYYKLDNLPEKIQKQIKSKFYKKNSKVDLIKFKTIKNYFFDEVYKVNKEIDFLAEKIEKRFKKSPKISKTTVKKTREEISISIGRGWEIDSNVKPLIFDNDNVLTINGFNKYKNAYDILKLIEMDKLQMQTYDLMYIVGRGNEYRIEIQHQDYELNE